MSVYCNRRQNGPGRAKFCLRLQHGSAYILFTIKFACDYNMERLYNSTSLYTVGSHNFNLRIFNLRVSNPDKLIVGVFLTRCRISMCQCLGPNKRDEISEIDRMFRASPGGGEARTTRPRAQPGAGTRLRRGATGAYIYIYIYIYIYTYIHIYIYRERER